MWEGREGVAWVCMGGSGKQPRAVQGGKRWALCGGLGGGQKDHGAKKIAMCREQSPRLLGPKAPTKKLLLLDTEVRTYHLLHRRLTC